MANWVNLITDFIPLSDPKLYTSMSDPGNEADGYEVEVRVAVRDNLGAVAYASEWISVQEPEVLDVESGVANAQDILNNGDTDEAMRLVKGLSGALNADAYVYLSNATNTSYYNATDGYYYVLVAEDAATADDGTSRRLLAEAPAVAGTGHRRLLAVPKWEPSRRRNLLRARTAPLPRRHLLQDAGGNNITEDQKAAQRSDMLSVVSSTTGMLYATAATTDTLATSVTEVVGVPSELSNDTQASAMGLIGDLIAGTQDASSEASLSGDAASSMCNGLSNLNEAVPSNGTDATEDSAARTSEAVALLSSMGDSLLSAAVDGMDPTEVASPTLAMKVQRDRADSNTSSLYSGPITSPGSASGVAFPASLGAALQGRSTNSTSTEAPPLEKQSFDLQLTTTASDAHFAVWLNDTNATAPAPTREPTQEDYLAFAMQFREGLLEYVTPEMLSTLQASARAGSVEELKALLAEAAAAGKIPAFALELLESMEMEMIEVPSGPHEELPGASGTVSIDLKGAAAVELNEGIVLTLSLADGMHGTLTEIESRGLTFEGRAECSYWDAEQQMYTTDGCAAYPNPAPQDAGLAWKSLHFEDFDYDTQKAWTVDPALFGDCQEVWDGVLEGWNGTDAGYRKYLNYTGGENETWVESSGCPITNPNTTALCFWNWTAQMFVGEGCIVSNTQLCLCNHLGKPPTSAAEVEADATPSSSSSSSSPPGPFDLKIGMNAKLGNLGPPKMGKQPSPASLSMADILGSVVLIAIAGSIIGGAMWMAVTSNTSDTEARRAILERLIARFGTGSYGYRLIGGTWTWSMFEEENMAAIEKGSKRQARGKRKERMAAKAALMDSTLNYAKKTKMRHMVKLLQGDVGSLSEEHLSPRQRELIAEETKYNVFHDWLAWSRELCTDIGKKKGPSDDSSDSDDGSESWDDVDDAAPDLSLALASTARLGTSLAVMAAAKKWRRGLPSACDPVATATGNLLRAARQYHWEQAGNNVALASPVGQPALEPPSSPTAGAVMEAYSQQRRSMWGGFRPRGSVETAGPVVEGVQGGEPATSLRETHTTMSDAAVDSLVDSAAGLFARPRAPSVAPQREAANVTRGATPPAKAAQGWGTAEGAPGKKKQKLVQKGHKHARLSSSRPQTRDQARLPPPQKATLALPQPGPNTEQLLGEGVKIGADVAAMEAGEREDAETVSWFKGFIPPPISEEELEKRNMAKLEKLGLKMREADGRGVTADDLRHREEQSDDDEFGMSDSDEEAAPPESRPGSASEELQLLPPPSDTTSPRSSREGTAASVERPAASVDRLPRACSSMSTDSDSTMDTSRSTSRATNASRALMVHPDVQQQLNAAARAVASPSPVEEHFPLFPTSDSPLPPALEDEEQDDTKQVAQVREDMDEERQRELQAALPLKTQ
eukprot:gene14402-17031_t